MSLKLVVLGSVCTFLPVLTSDEKDLFPLEALLVIKSSAANIDLQG